MIQTGFESRVKIQQIVDSQLPEFILDESPKTVDFLKQYYISQEYQGGSIDISENLDQYLKVDNLTPEVIVGSTVLLSSISSSDTVIQVSSTKGFPSSYGLLKIDDEIITYTGITTNTFTGCVRGFSGITDYHQELNNGELVFSTSESESHTESAVVHNLSSLFLKEFFNKLKYSLTPDLESKEFVSNLNVGNFIKEARTLYESKGTEESYKILFNVLFGETPKVIDLEQFLIKPSSASYKRRIVAVADLISGDALKLKGQTIFKNTDINTTASVSEVEVIRRKGNTYYKLLLFVGYDDAFPTITGDFNITGTTRNLAHVSVGSSVISVDSTIGFSESGTIYCGNNIITYTDKSINQFFGCSGVNEEISPASIVRSNETYYGYEDGDVSKKVELRITGVLSDYLPTTSNAPISPGEKIKIKNIGKKIKNEQINPSYQEIFANSWIYNTSSRYQIESIDSETQITLKSDIDKSSLKVNDYIDILSRGSQDIVASNLRVLSINEGTRQIQIDSSFTSPSGLNYDIRRKIKTASSSIVPLEFNPIISDVQNTYDENAESMYVASNSLPSYQITKSIFSYNVISVSGKDEYTDLYSIITFSEKVSFITGSEVNYKFSNSSISGLSQQTYYVEVINDYQIKLYLSRSVIGTENYVKFGELTPGTHNFTLNSQKEVYLSPQKLLRKFTLSPNVGDGTSELTTPGSVGMLINGVEIFNYKSNDKVYYGSLEKIDVLNGGSGYDVINPPLLSLSYGNASIQPIIKGSVEKIYVTPQDFDIDVVVSIALSGGNGKGASFKPVIEKRVRELEFDARELEFGGGIGIGTGYETITFLKHHNLTDGQAIKYDTKGNSPLGIGSFYGSNNSSGDTLKNGSTYYAKFISSTTIQLYQSISDFNSGINTVGFTTIGTSGIHKFITEPKNTLTEIKVINGGSEYSNRKLRVSTSGISTTNSTISFTNHGFNDGELVTYASTGSVISGLSTVNQYHILKVDDDEFKLSDAGIGGTVRLNYERRKYVSLGSTGSGYHIFNYPEISLSVEYTSVGIGSTQTKGTIDATPIVRGKIDGIYVYDGGTNYGSTILNYHKKPSITVKNGKFAQFIPIIINGRIEDVSIQYGGVEYYSTPDIKVTGDGVGAVLRAVVTNNKITDIVVINSGYGYSAENTSISAVPSGKNAVFDPQIRSLSVNNNVFYKDVNDTNTTTDELILTTDNNLQYGVCGYNEVLQNEFNDINTSHSPIIGWAYDGNPIYGSYGYSDPKSDNNIGIITSGYILNPNNITNRPAFAPGFFIEDYQFTDCGDLDEYNGRFCITPEFPNGVYAYFATSVTNNEGNIVGAFPYFIGNRYRSKFIPENKYLNQSFNFNQSNLIRNTFPYKINDPYADNDFISESNEVTNQVVNVESVTSGYVTGFDIVSSGEDYEINDLLQFNEEETNGSGLVAQVSEIEGKEISNLQTTSLSYNNVIFVWENGNQIKIKIDPQHNLENLNYVNISGFSTYLSDLNGFQQIGVSTYSAILINSIPTNSPGIVTDIYVSNIPQNVSIGSSIIIENETLTILNIFENQNVVRVLTSTGSAHTITSQVYFAPDTFTINKSVNYFESKINDLVYFNPHYSVGVGTTSNVGVAVTYNVGVQTNNSVFVPTQSIYLPNHPFTTNQQIILSKPGVASSISVANTEGSTPFDLPFSGDSATVFAIKKSKDYIGIVTQVGLTTTTNGLFFLSNGSNDYQYKFQSIFNQVKGNVQSVKTKVSISTDHNLLDGDKINLFVKPNLSVGIGTSLSIKVLRDSITGCILINPITFNSSGINTESGTITINSHNFRTGDKIKYSANQVATGLSTGFYFIYKVDDNTIKLSETYIDCVKTQPPNTVGISSTGGSTQIISLVNPQIKSIKNNNIVFDLSDSSLLGYKFKIFYDENFSDEFISNGYENTFSVTGVGTVGVSTNASLTLNYNDSLPEELFYSLSKFGVNTDPDKDVVNYSNITFIDSYYNNSYKISGVGSTYFDIFLNNSPERNSYSKLDCETLKYTTNSNSTSGGISKIRTISPGIGFKKLPTFEGVQSTNGSGAYIIPKSDSIGSINEIRILNEGFEYSSDKTLRPEALIPNFISIKNSSKISSVSIVDGGNNYNTAPNLVVIDSVTGETINSGLLIPKITSNKITSVSVDIEPKGLPETPVLLRAVNNTNGVGIETVYSSSSGIVTCILVTPISGFTQEPFSIGDTIFVEGIQKYGLDGDGLNSENYNYEFFEVSGYYATNPRKLEYNLSGLTTNPGIAKTDENFYGRVINYKDYPKFEVQQSLTNFILGELLEVKIQNAFTIVDLRVTESNRNYIKVSGTYELSANQIIRGSQSGTIATVNENKVSNGTFIVSYGSPQRIGWADEIGKLNEDIQVISDNDYYQNLSYSVKSSQEWIDIVSPVNGILHPAGLKNFADTQIQENTSIGFSATEYTSVLYDIINENRVDTINNFDLVVDVDIFGNTSRFLKFTNKKLSDYIECKTNRVLEIDDISSQFSSYYENEDLNETSFELNYQNTPIFMKTFDPSDSSILNLSNNQFTIENHFFSTGEELIYRPNTSVVGGATSSLSIVSTLNYLGVSTNRLPQTVYAIKITNNTFKVASRKEYAIAGIGVTFTSVGIGNSHEFEMVKKNEKSIISINNVIQSPIAYSLLNYNVNNGGQIGTASTIFGLSGISSISLNDILKIDDEYMKVVNVGLGTTYSGPISFAGTFPLVNVKRGFVGSAITTHSDFSSASIYRGSFNIVKNTIYFTDAPYGNLEDQINGDIDNLPDNKAYFNGRVFLRKDYTTNRVYDNISERFTGIGQTYTLTVGGANTVGLGTSGGNGIVLINGIYQTPTTRNNLNNNFRIVENIPSGTSSIVFSGITSSNGSTIISQTDVNLNQLPRGGLIVSLGSTPGLGYAPLVGASVTAIVSGGIITGIGTLGTRGSGYRSPVSVAVTDSTGGGAVISASVGAGGTLSFTVVSGGSGYTNPIINISPPSYSNLPITGVSRLGVGQTTDCGNGLLLNIEVGASSTTGIGSTLFEVSKFEIVRSGYGFKKGDVVKAVGLVTARGLSQPVSDFELTILETFSDSFSCWQFGELDYIDSIKNLQDGARTRFPLYYNQQLLSFEKTQEDPDSQLIDFNSLLVIFVNGILQKPGFAYEFTGGTSFTFTEAPKPEDDVSIYFYRGSSSDSSIVNVNETIKKGDDVQVFSNNNYLGITTIQNSRIVYDILTSDTLETNQYFDQGIDIQTKKPLYWTKQKVDKNINGEIVSKARDILEPQIYPTAKIIKNVTTSDTTLYVDNAQFFNYEGESPGQISFDGLIISGSPDPVSAAVTAIVSSAGTIQSLSINNVGSGYTGSSINVKIASPPASIVGFGTTLSVGLGTTATASISIVNGSLSTVTITNPGYGYTKTNPPQVLVPSPKPVYENISNVSQVSGSSGEIIDITTTSGVGVPLAIKFTLSSVSGLSVGDRIYVSNTAVGKGITSINTSNTDIIGIGTTCVDNIYYIHNISSNDITCNIHSGSYTTGVSTNGSFVGSFSWGKLSGFSRSSSPISLSVSGFTINPGLTTFPTIQRRGYGLRDNGSIIKSF